MPYSAQDKYEMALRQSRVDIGQGRGNALSKAVDLCGASERKFKSDEEMFEWIFAAADKFAQFNQERIDTDWNKWFSLNADALKQELGLEEPTIDGETLQFPKRTR